MKTLIIAAVLFSAVTASNADEFMPQPIPRPQPDTHYSLVITVPYRNAVIPFDNRESCGAFRKFWLATHYPNAVLLKRAIPDVQCVPDRIDSGRVYEAEGE